MTSPNWRATTSSGQQPRAATLGSQKFLPRERSHADFVALQLLAPSPGGNTASPLAQIPLTWPQNRPPNAEPIRRSARRCAGLTKSVVRRGLVPLNCTRQTCHNPATAASKGILTTRPRGFGNHTTMWCDFVGCQLLRGANCPNVYSRVEQLDLKSRLQIAGLSIGMESNPRQHSLETAQPTSSI